MMRCREAVKATFRLPRLIKQKRPGQRVNATFWLVRTQSHGDVGRLCFVTRLDLQWGTVRLRMLEPAPD